MLSSSLWSPGLNLLFLSAVPAAFALSPVPRWGQQAVYVPSQQSLYVVGGEVSSGSLQITNEVLTLNLSSSNPSFSTGPSTNLPPHAFAAVAITPTEKLIVTGGLTTSCSSDALTHTLDIGGGSTDWTNATPHGLVRRRGADGVWFDNGSTDGAVMVIGGLLDKYVCSSGTFAYSATDILSTPLSDSTNPLSRSLPSRLTGTELAVADYATATLTDGRIVLAGGQTTQGSVVDLSTIGIWDINSGWTSQVTSGDIPAARVGHTMVVHPTKDLIILHGGSTIDSTSLLSSSNSTTLVAFLNTTTFEWSTPSNLQPPASAARSWHSSVMTPSGVMITGFGLSASGSPTNDIYYLDMRHSHTDSWSWKSQWTTKMLAAVDDDASVTSAIISTSTGKVAAASSDSSAPSPKTIASIVVPILVVLLLCSPIIVYLVRRRIRVIRKRRMARHFSFSSQEDAGDFRGPLAQYKGRRRAPKTPFGQDANELDTTFIQSLSNSITGLWKKSDSSAAAPGSAEHGREMAEVANKASRAAGGAEKVHWEEIDFGLGKVDESRRSSFSATSSPPNGEINGPLSEAGIPAAQGYDPRLLYNSSVEGATPPLIVTIEHSSPRMGSPVNDSQAPLIPSLVILPPTQPPTPAIESPEELTNSYPVMSPTPITGDEDEWSSLSQNLVQNPVFRSISTSSSLRSFSHPAPAPPPVVMPSPPAYAHQLPPLEFQRVPSPVPTIRLVKQDSGRRSSETLPYTSRSVSQPLNRSLYGSTGLGRRDSAPLAGQTRDSPSSSGSSTPTARRSSYAHAYDGMTYNTPYDRRASNPSPSAAPSAVLPETPLSPGNRRGSHMFASNGSPRQL